MPALGKGLSSLIPNKKLDPEDIDIDSPDFDSKKIQYVPLGQITANPWQPRTRFDRDKLQELADSIAKHGIIQPMVVTKEGNKFQLIAGERRLKASELLKMKEVPVIVREASDRDKFEMSIIENIQRHDLDPLEEGASYKRLMEEFGLTYEDIARHVSKGVSTIANYVRLLSLPIVIKEALTEKKITLSHAKLILTYPNKTEQIKIYKKILKDKIDVTKLQAMTTKTAEKAREQKPNDPILTSWEDKLTKSLGSKTSIQKRGEKGFIRVNFYSHGELKDILDKFIK